MNSNAFDNPNELDRPADWHARLASWWHAPLANGWHWRPASAEEDTGDTPVPATANGGGPVRSIDPKLLLACIHCGLCTSSCPTYTELGDENDGPRGRIQLMRMVADGNSPLTDRMRRHLELCLDCRACETACPSGVRYGRLIEPFRLAVEAGRRADRAPLRSVP